MRPFAVRQLGLVSSHHFALQLLHVCPKQSNQIDITYPGTYDSRTAPLRIHRDEEISLVAKAFYEDGNMFEFLGLGRARRARKKYDQQEMIHFALTSVLYRHGIAPKLIGCELVSLTQPRAGDVTPTQLVVLSWKKGSMRYAPDLESELFDAIQIFDRSARPADFLFVWKFAPDGGASSGKLQESKFWNSMPDMESPTPEMAVSQSIEVAATAGPAVKFDLPKSDLDRDEHGRDFGFPATVIDSR